MNIIVSKENVNVGTSLAPTFFRRSVGAAVSPGIEHVFSKELVERIYNFGEYYGGSKRIFKIHRGVLGDASKLMLGAPNTLADSMDFDISNDATDIVPIVLKSSTQNILKTFYIFLNSIDTKQKSIIENSENKAEENYTEVQILLPYDDSGDDYILYRLRTFLRNYSVLNIHITFDFVVPHRSMKNSLFLLPNQ